MYCSITFLQEKIYVRLIEAFFVRAIKNVLCGVKKISLTRIFVDIKTGRTVMKLLCRLIILCGLFCEAKILEEYYPIKIYLIILE